MTILFIDFETRSTVDLKAAGLHNYAAHETTTPLCMAYAFGDGPVGICHSGSPVPSEVLQHVASGGTVVAHNAAFEIAIWPKLNTGILLRPKQCLDTMVEAYAMSLPGSLEQVALAVGLPVGKDMAGRRLMLQMSRPRTTEPLTWWEEPEKLEKLFAYCKTDVEVEREVHKRLLRLSVSEHELWCLDQQINDRGVYIDRDAIQAAIEIVRHEQDRLNKSIREVTDGAVSFYTEVSAITKWIRSKGVQIEGVAKSAVLDALSTGNLPAEVETVLRIRQEGSKTSTAKLTAMLSAASADGRCRNAYRLRDMFQFHGAGTGRWAGRRVQLQNLPRPKLKADEVELAIQAVTRWADSPKLAAQYLNVFHGAPLDVISWSLRGMLKAAPGNVLYAADFANIEGRGLAWLAGEEWKLDAFRAYDAGTGPDLYLVAAAGIYSKPVDAYDEHSPERQTGKVSELSLGYGGGLGAFRNMERSLGLKLGLSDSEVQKTKDAWREKHKAIVEYWKALEESARDAIQYTLDKSDKTQDGKYPAGPKDRPVSFRVAGSFLWAKLPSGRVLCYPYPRLDRSRTYKKPDGKRITLSGRAIRQRKIPEEWELVDESEQKRIWYMSVNGMTNKWEETHTYGGKLSENVTQAICRDLLAAAMVNVEREKYPVVLHVHDEIVSETEESFGSLAEFEKLCSQMPPWARGLPVVAKGWVGERYRKG